MIRSLRNPGRNINHGGPKTRKGARGRRIVLELERMEERTLLSASPIRIGSLGDSLTDEYQFYAPDRTAASNWVETLSTLRSAQVTFGDFSTATRGETRNQGYAQNWARSGATAIGPDVVGAGTYFVNQYNGGDPAGAPGLLTQPGGLSNVDVVTILIGGNDYEAALENGLKQGFLQTITSSDVGSLAFEVVGGPLFNALEAIPDQIEQGVSAAITAIHSQNPNMPIVLVSPPDVGFTPLAREASAFLDTLAPSAFQGLLLRTLKGISDQVYGKLQTLAGMPGNVDTVKLVDLDKKFTAFVANPTIDGTYIDPTAGGPSYTDLFVGDDFHPGTVGQAILANAIVDQIDAFFPGAITPLSDREIVDFAKSTQPVTQTVLTASASSTAAGIPITFTAQVSSFPNVNSTTILPQDNFSAHPPTGTVTFIDVAQGNKLLGIAPLVPVGSGTTYTGSTATLTTSSLGAGLHQVVAIYNGDSIYPSASTSTALTYVGTPSQTQLFSFVSQFQAALGVQIAEPQLDRWNRRLHAGAPPQHVARSIMRYVYNHTHLPRHQAALLMGRARHAAAAQLHRNHH